MTPCVAAGIAWFLAFHLSATAPPVEPSCYVKRLWCEVAAQAARDAFRSLGRADVVVECHRR